jgi:hypothetical protein
VTIKYDKAMSKNNRKKMVASAKWEHEKRRGQDFSAKHRGIFEETFCLTGFG